MNNRKTAAGCGTFILTWIIVSVITGALLAAINKTGQSIGTVAFMSVGIGFLAAIVVFAFRMTIRTSKISSDVKRQRERDRQQGIERFASIVHVGGLTAPENCNGVVTLSPTVLTINCGGGEYVLNIEKITNVSFQTDVNVIQYLKSSMARGVIGAASFGTTGAIIGSAPKTKTKREIKGYAVISYEDAHGEHKTFLLRDEVANTGVCSRLIGTLRPRITQRVNRVEL